MTPHVSILIPSRGQRALANLARDAIAAFTEDVSHEMWSLDHAGASGWPYGSEATGLALTAMLRGAHAFFVQRPSHIFVMHDDALPLRPGWLAYLLSKPGPVTGVKESEGTKCAHGSGVLYAASFLGPDSLREALPQRDAGEWSANWTAESHPHRQNCLKEECESQWWGGFDCDLSFDDKGQPWYVHFGGGTLNNRPDRDALITAAREALEL